MTPEKNEEIQRTERITGASRVGLWKMLTVSLVLVVIGFAVIAGVTAQ